MRVAGVGLLTGWGEGLAALPAHARRAAGSRSLIPLAAPPLGGERFRRATRECLFGVTAVYALLREAGLGSEAIAGGDTALIYVTAGGYGASNRAFIEAAASAGRESGGALYFPYTAPSAIPAEVTIEFGIRGPYVILIGGAAATIEALRQADRMLAEGTCARALVLAVETFAECADLYARGRWLVERPLVEAAACALLLPGGNGMMAGPAERASPLEEAVRRRVGETLACAPLIGLALACAAGDGPWELTGQWRRRRLALRGERSPAGPRR